MHYIIGIRAVNPHLTVKQLQAIMENRIAIVEQQSTSITENLLLLGEILKMLKDREGDNPHGPSEPPDPVTINGLFCKNLSEVTSNDFLFQGFNTIGNTNNRFGSAPSMVNATRFPALNTLGIAMGRVDYAPGGLNPPHYHPRASEMFTVLQGTLFVGFITSNLPNGVNRLYSTVLNTGDIFVIPRGLIHFQLNIGGTHAVTNAAFGSQNPGRIGVADAIFGSMPGIPHVVLETTFQVNVSVIHSTKEQFH